MNHSFHPKALDPKQCAVCSRSLLDHHPTLAQCEVCSNKGECDIVNTILMCSSCAEKEKKLQTALVETTSEREIIMKDYYKLRDETYKGVTNYAGYFNARITPIAELKELYDLNGHSFAEFHARIKDQIAHFEKVLFEQVVENKPDEISNLLIEFRAEVRTKLKEQDITYQPPSKAPKIARPKSGLERMAMELMKIKPELTLHEAKQRLLKEMGQ